MAGIGFKIQKLLAEDTYWGVVKGYFYSAVISSGPWLISIICIGTLGMLFQPLLSTDEHFIFRAWVTYCYAASLVISGATQVSLTRYISDLIYTKEDEAVFSSYVTYSIPTIFANILLSAGYLSYCELPIVFVYAGAILYAVINQIWIAMIYLSAAKDYVTIVLAYIIGGRFLFFGGRLRAQWFSNGLYGGAVGFVSGAHFAYRYRISQGPDY
jgi:polysaccharide biosynthesis protein PelG